MTVRQRVLFTAAKVAALIDEPMPATGPDQVLVEMDHTVVGNGTERARLLGIDTVKPIISGVLPPQDAPGFYRRLAEDEHVPTGMAFAWR